MGLDDKITSLNKNSNVQSKGSKFNDWFAMLFLFTVVSINLISYLFI
jgi:hypothetical protein